MRTLLPGQYELDGMLLGKGTPYKIGAFDIQPYGVAAGDFQVPMQDENRFGKDQITPGPINITFNLVQNRWLRDPIPGAVLISADAGRLQRTWRGDHIRYEWGAMQALYFGANDGTQKVIYGRTGKFQYPRFNEKTEAYECVGEYRRADTLAYGTTRWVRNVPVNSGPVFVTDGHLGDAPTWVILHLQGPMNGAQINFGGQEFELDWNIPAGKILEISSYPFARRCVDSDGINRRANLVGATPYLDRLRFNYNQEITMSVLANGTNGDSKATASFFDAYQVVS